MLLEAVTAVALQWATFYGAYVQGVNAQARLDHATALQAFSSAIVQRPEPAARVKTYGLNYLSNYHPYLRLAESAIFLGEFDQAEQALSRSRQFGIEPEWERAQLMDRLAREKARSVRLQPQELLMRKRDVYARLASALREHLASPGPWSPEQRQTFLKAHDEVFLVASEEVYDSVGVLLDLHARSQKTPGSVAPETLQAAFQKCLGDMRRDVGFPSTKATYRFIE